jgi:hypothetical protein
MNIDTPSDDPLDRLLGPLAAAPPTDPLRDSVLNKTVGLVRRRRHWRRIQQAAALAACYLAGLGTMWLAHRPSQPEVPMAIRTDSGPPEQPSSAKALPLEEDLGVPALVIERVASASGGDRLAQLYRRAGDRYLEQNGDYQAATRCYERALEVSTEAELAIAPDDSWLLTALKKARLEDKSHVRMES